MYNTKIGGSAVTAKQVALIVKLHDEGKTYTWIAQETGLSITTVRRYCQLARVATGHSVEDRERPFIATEKTCGGCHYFRKLHATDQRENFCAYTLITGKAKDITVPCAKCKLKKPLEGKK